MADVFGSRSGTDVSARMIAIVRRATEVVREHIHVLTVEPKANHHDAHDCTTNADHAAQRVYIAMLREEFPRFGIVAEEDELQIPCELLTRDAYFTVDPVDGSKALARKESKGIGTMLALVVEGHVVAAVVGDINTQDIVSCHPDSADVTFHPPLPHAARILSIDVHRALREQTLLLRERRDEQTTMRDILDRHQQFAGREVLGGSVGIGMVHLWKGDVGATVLRANQQTPWDLAPIVGISQRLGFVFLRPELRDGEPTGALEIFRPPMVKQQYETVHETLVVHRSRLDELHAWGMTIRPFA